jgi:hypothetical protein
MKQSERFNSNFNKQVIEKFGTYKLIQTDINLITDFSKKVLMSIPQKSFNCAQMSAILGAMLIDNSEIPTLVISGHFDYKNERLFNCLNPIPFDEEKNIDEIWDGHCWVEVPNLILDLSFFRTIYYGNVDDKIKIDVINDFGEGKGTLIAPIEQMNEWKFNYTPCYEVDEKTINGLINSI